VRSKTISARVSLAFYERVKAVARERGVSVSDVVREALVREIEGSERKKWWKFW